MQEVENISQQLPVEDQVYQNIDSPQDDYESETVEEEKVSSREYEIETPDEVAVNTANYEEDLLR